MQALFTISLLLISNTLMAEFDSHDEHHTSHEAHVHGEAELTLAVEGSDIELIFKSPAANIVGFEHTAQTKEQELAISQARSTLESAKSLFNFGGASCQPQTAAADFSSMTHQKQSSIIDGHEKENHDHNDIDDNKHSEVTATYHFKCESGTEVTSVTVNLLDYFSGIEHLNVMWVTSKQQGATELSAKSNIIQLRQ